MSANSSARGNSIYLTVYKAGEVTATLTFYSLDANGSQVLTTIGNGSKVRVRIGRGDSAALITITSGSPLENGTSVTAENPATLTIVGADFAALASGVYDIESAIIDAADGNAAKIADEGVFVLLGSMA